MADTRDNTKKRPWGFLRAVLPKRGEVRENERESKFLDLGAVWETENGNLRFSLEVEPVQWSDPRFERVVLIVRNIERDKPPSSSSSSSAPKQGGRNAR